MRRGWVAILLLSLLLAPMAAPSAHAHTDVWSPSYVNYLLDHFETPDLAPGERGTFRVTFTNSYPWQMRNATLRFEVYRYVQLDRDVPVDTSWTGHGPAFVVGGADVGLRAEWSVLGPNRTRVLEPLEWENITFEVVTHPDTPHGGLTDQGSYFVRSRLEFDRTNGTTTDRSVMMSRGYFTDAQWAAAQGPCGLPSDCVGLLNMTVLGAAYGLDHLDGLLPDTAFSVTERMPLWPYFAVGGVMVASLAFAILFYAEENPGKYPRLARWWLAVKGRARGVRPPRTK